jgi:hypothetical protein
MNIDELNRLKMIAMKRCSDRIAVAKRCMAEEPSYGITSSMKRSRGL